MKNKKMNSDEITVLTNEWMCREINVETTLSQLRYGNPARFMSWGVHKVGNLKGKAVIFTVNGYLFKGLVVITLSAMDTYDVHFIEPFPPGEDKAFPDGYFVLRNELTLTDVYCDQIAELIDGVVEQKAA